MARGNTTETNDSDNLSVASARRRRLLGALGAASVAGLTGCVGLQGGGNGSGGGGGSGGEGGGSSNNGTGGGSGSAGSSNRGPIVFGQPAALTGKWDYLQPAVSQASDLAVSEINDAGGPLGATLSLKRRDTAVDPQQARSVTQQLINNDGATALLGLYSSEITPLFDFLAEQRTPIVTPWPGTTALDERGGDGDTPEDLNDDGWVWRTVIGDTVHTIGAARKMLDEGFDQVGILNGTSQGERSWADAFSRAYEGNGGTVTQRVEVEEGKASYQSELDRLFGGDFGGWALAVALEDAITIIREWSSGGYGRQLLLEDGLREQDLISGAGEPGQGAWLAAATSQGPNYDAFLSKFEERGDAEIHPWAVAAYDAVNVAALAAHRGGSGSAETIERNLGPVSRPGGTEVTTFADGKKALDDGEEVNYQGAATPTDFTGFGNVFGEVSVERITPSGFEQVDSIPAEELEPLVDTY